jgi:uncharacterized membrane protein YidH (DUF202 family)
MAETSLPTRPERLTEAPVPPIPTPDLTNSDGASVEFSRYRTGLSHHRTELSEHRTDLSEFRTDLSTHRTDLSTRRTAMSTQRTEMSMRRTGMSFQRTRMSGDRTLMSVIRTSLSLIGFGFTIYQTFEKLRDAGVIQHAAAPRNFGLVLIVLGILLLIGGLLQELQFNRELRRNRQAMAEAGLVHAESGFPRSIPVVVALALLLTGLAAVASIVFNVSLFG